MAITFFQQPGEEEVSGAFLVQSSDNPITYVFKGDHWTFPNFSYIVETLVNGLVVSTDVVHPERSGKAHKDVSITALSYATKPKRATATIINPVTLPTIEIKVYERYGDPAVTYDAYPSRQVKFMKANCPDEVYANNWMPTKYVPNIKWITNVPQNNVLVSRKYPVWLSMFNALADSTTRIEFYNEAGEVPLTSILPVSGTPDRVDVYLSPALLNIQLSTVPLTLADIVKIKIKIADSEFITIDYIGDECIEFHQLSWLNNLGTYDQFLFTHNMEKESSITLKEYKKQFGSWNIDDEYEYDANESGETAYQKTIQPTGTIYSGFVSQEYYKWLNSIIESVDVILFQPEEPVQNRIVVTDSRTTEPKTRFEEILNFQVSYKKTNFKSVTL